MTYEEETKPERKTKEKTRDFVKAALLLEGHDFPFPSLARNSPFSFYFRFFSLLLRALADVF